MSEESQAKKPDGGQGSWFNPPSVVLGIVVGVVLFSSITKIAGWNQKTQGLTVTNTTSEAVDVEGLTIEPGKTGHFSLPDKKALKVNGIGLATFELKSRTAALVKDVSGKLEFRFTDE